MRKAKCVLVYMPRAAQIEPLVHVGYSTTSIGAGKERLRHGKAERLRGLEVDHQPILGRSLHRKIGRLLTLEYAIDIARRLLELLDEIRPIRHQAAGSDEDAFPVDRRGHATPTPVSQTLLSTGNSSRPARP